VPALTRHVCSKWRRSGDEVNALVGVWKYKQFTDLSGHLAQRPDVSKFGSVFRLGLEVELDEAFEGATLLGVGELPRPLPEILPRGAGGNKSVYAVHDPSLKQTCGLPQAPTLEALPRGIVASMWYPHQATCCSGGEWCPAAPV